MLHDDMARLSDLSWLELSYQLEGDEEKAEQVARMVQRIRHHSESGQDWDSMIDRFDSD